MACNINVFGVLAIVVQLYVVRCQVYHGASNAWTFVNTSQISDYLTLYNIDLAACIEACERRIRCNAIKYRRRTKACHLLENPISTMSAEVCDIRNCESVVYHEITTANRSCGENVCNKTQVCDILKKECLIKECDRLEATDSYDVRGNMHSIGNKVITVCKPGFYFPEAPMEMTHICDESDGNWSPRPRECEPVPEWICPEDFNGPCYLLGNGSLFTFDEAKNFCGEQGGHLAHIEDANENEYLQDYLVSIWPNRKDTCFWIVERTSLGHGTTLTTTYTKFWYPPRLDGAARNESCATLWFSTGFYWNYTPCTYMYKCEAAC